MATLAPRDARFDAMERPMPRDAPVTRATCPVRSNMGYRAQRLDPVYRSDVRFRSPPLQHVREDTAGSHLDEPCYAGAGEESHDLHPPHRLHDLLPQILANVVPTPHRPPPHLAHDRDSRGADSDVVNGPGEFGRSRLHE